MNNLVGRVTSTFRVLVQQQAQTAAVRFKSSKSTKYGKDGHKKGGDKIDKSDHRSKHHENHDNTKPSSIGGKPEPEGPEFPAKEKWRSGGYSIDVKHDKVLGNQEPCDHKGQCVPGVPREPVTDPKNPKKDPKDHNKKSKW